MSRADLPWRSRFIYGTGGDVVDWQTELPARPWTPVTATIGGSRTAASGTPAAYVVRRDENIRLSLRVYETELPDVAALIAWGQEAETILWLPDANDTTESYFVYLEGPLAGETWEPVRDASYPKVFTVDLVFRLTVPGPWALDYFPDA